MIQKLKEIIKELQKIHNNIRVVVYNNKPYILTVDKSIHKGEDYLDGMIKDANIVGELTDYSLYSAERFSVKPIAYCSIIYSHLTQEQIKKIEGWGLNKVDEHLFYLDIIDVLPKHQNKGLGSFLLNIAISEAQKMAEENNIECSLMLNMLNTNQAKHFYTKWGAKSNNCDSDEIEKNLIIPNATPNEKYKGIRVCPLKVIAVGHSNRSLTDVEDIICDKEM